MHPIPRTFFGPSGIPCVFADLLGKPTVGYITKQLSTNTYKVSDGTHQQVCKLASTAEEVSGLPSSIPSGVFAIQVQNGNNIEYIKKLTEYKCSTIEGNSLSWHSKSGNSIIAPVLLLFQNINILPNFSAGSSSAWFSSEHGNVICATTTTGWYVLIDGSVAYALSVSDSHVNYAAISMSYDGSKIIGFLQKTSPGYPFNAIEWTNGSYALIDSTDNSSPVGISADGNIIIENYYNTAEVYSVNNGIKTLISTMSAADCVSGDGNVIFGTSSDLVTTGYSKNGMFYTLTTPLNYSANLYLSNYDGSILCGYMVDQNNINYPTFWQNGQYYILSTYSNINVFGQVVSISGDGLIMAGNSMDDYENYIPTYWKNGQIYLLPVPLGNTGIVNGISPDGSTILGAIYDGHTYTPVTWTS